MSKEIKEINFFNNLYRTEKYEVVRFIHHFYITNFGAFLEHFWCWFGAFIYSLISHFLQDHIIFLCAVFCACFVPVFFGLPYTKKSFYYHNKKD